MKTMGIYQIVNMKNNKRYIGSSNNIEKRFAQHLENLNKGTHHCTHLQNSYDKHGICSFYFNIVEVVNDSNLLLDIEQIYIDKYDLKTELYNMNATSVYGGVNATDSILSVIEELRNMDKDTIVSIINNLNIYERQSKRMNSIGEGKYDATQIWFRKGNNINIAKNAISNYFKNLVKAKSEDIVWTTYYQFKDQIKGKGYSCSYVHIDGYKDAKLNKKTLAFVCNPVPNGFSKSMVKIDGDEYAIAMTIRWIVSVSDLSSRVDIFIVSQRIERLIKQWIENKRIEFNM